VTPMATQPVTDDMSSMSGVSSPVLQERSGGGGGGGGGVGGMGEASGIVSSSVRSLD
jgi:hypothetical protein